jgi:hypothetical protein
VLRRQRRKNDFTSRRYQIYGLRQRAVEPFDWGEGSR